MTEVKHKPEDVKPGDEVFYKTVNMDELGNPTFYDRMQSSHKTAVMENGVLVLQGTHIRVDRMEVTDAIKQGVIFTYAESRQAADNDRSGDDSIASMSPFLTIAHLNEDYPSTLPFTVELYSSHSGRVWCKTADRRWFCLSAKNGATMSSTVIRNIKALGHAPISELPMRRLTIDMARYAIQNEPVISPETTEDTPESIEYHIQ